MEQEEEPKKRGIRLQQDEQSLYRKGNSYFLGIGIDEYQNKFHFQTLKNAVLDVETIGRLLNKDFEFEKPKYLINGNANYRKVFNKLFTFTGDLSDQDNLLIYFAGHGGIQELRDGVYPYWACHDTDPENPSSLLSNSQIKDLLENSAAKHIFLISDSCYSGTFLEMKRSNDNYPLLNEELAQEYEKKSSRWVLCSTEANQLATDGKEGAHSPFAGSIISVLEDHKATLINVGFFIEQVRRVAHGRNQGQIPMGGQLENTRHERGQLIFRPRLFIEKSSFKTDFRKKVSMSASSKNPISEIKRNFKTTSSFRERVKLLFEAAQLQKQNPKQTAIDQLVNDLLKAIEKEERSLFHKKKELKDHPSFPFLQTIIRLLTKKNLDNMEDFLRKSCELMLYDLEISILSNRWVLRDFCGKKSEDFEALISDIEEFRNKIGQYFLDSKFIRINTKTLAKRIEKESEENALEFIYHSDSYRFNHKVKSQLDELKDHKLNWLSMIKSDEAEEEIFKHQTDEVLIQLKILKEILDIIYAKTFESDFSLS